MTKQSHFLMRLPRLRALPSPKRLRAGRRNPLHLSNAFDRALRRAGTYLLDACNDDLKPLNAFALVESKGDLLWRRCEGRLRLS